MGNYEHLTKEEFGFLVANLQSRLTSKEAPAGFIGVSTPVEFFNEFISENNLNAADYLGNKYRIVMAPLTEALVAAIGQRGIFGVGHGDLDKRRLSDLYYLNIFKTYSGYKLLVSYQTLTGNWDIYNLSDEEVQAYKDKYRELMLNR